MPSNGIKNNLDIDLSRLSDSADQSVLLTHGGVYRGDQLHRGRYAGGSGEWRCRCSAFHPWLVAIGRGPDHFDSVFVLQHQPCLDGTHSLSWFEPVLGGTRPGFDAHCWPYDGYT